ncbi:Jerky protein [Trichinella spiralis]|uniref:Jerky protein n=1 Tax=Trichinella spiralis TaxID=6334 RepID=A0A0V1B3G7_TRISP|nr:Jerky protein [Trichinella spiralis]
MSISREGKILSLEQKIEMCKLVERGESFRKIAESLGVDLSTVSDIYCSRRQLTDFVFHMDTSNSCSSRIIDEKRQIKGALDRPISGPILQEKALAFSPKLGIDNFVASPGWLRNLTRLAKSWHGIRELKIHSEKLSADIPPKTECSDNRSSTV